MSVKKIVVLSSLLVLALGFGMSSLAGDQVVIKHWYHQYGEAGTQEAAMRYAEEYMKINPDVTVEVTWVPGDYGTKLSAALLTDDGPDVFEINNPSPAYVAAGQIAPLDDLYTDKLRADFGATELSIGTIGNTIYGVKMITDPIAVYYSKSMLKDAGVEVPTTMDELIEAAKSLTSRRTKGLYIGNDGGLSIWIGRQMIWSAGNDLFDADGKIAFDNERTDKAILKLGELYKSESVLMGSPTEWWDPSALIDGLVAMQFCGLWAAPQLMKEMGDDLGMFVWPALDEQGTPAITMSGWSQMVNANSPNIDAAKAYVKWLWIENTDIQKDWSLSYGFHIPPRSSAAAEAEALTQGVPKAFVDGLNQYGKPMGPYWTNAMDTILTTAIVNIIKNDVDPRAEISAAAQKCQAELDAIQ